MATIPYKMEFRQYHCNVEIQSISGQQWKDMCKELGLKQAGRRDELRMRVISFLYSTEGKVKISEIAASTMLLKVLNLLKLPPPGQKPPPVKDKVAEAVKTCVCGSLVSTIGLICAKCQAVQHKNCMGKAAQMPEFICPLCQMRQMEPFEQVVEVLLPPSVTSSMGQGAVQRQFVFSEEMNKRLQEPGRKRVIQIRSIRLDEEGFTHHWPKECTVLLNGKALFTYSQPPASSSRKRKDSSLAVSALGIGQNQAMVMRQKEEDAYAFGIFIVEVQTPEAVFRTMSTASVLTLEAGKSFVLSRTSSFDEVKAELCKCSLKCPLTRFLPEVPARGSKCLHIQCFDLRAYIVLQERAKTCRWRCPICKLLVLNMVVDKYMQAIIEKANDDCAASVEFLADGRFVLIPDSDDEGEEPPPRKLPRVPLELVDGKVVIRPVFETVERFVWEQFASGGVTLSALYASLSYLNAWKRASISRTDIKPVPAAQN